MAKFTNFENNLVNQFNYLSHCFSTIDDSKLTHIKNCELS